MIVAKHLVGSVVVVPAGGERLARCGLSIGLLGGVP
jgi:hypothetical protein